MVFRAARIAGGASARHATEEKGLGINGEKGGGEMTNRIREVDKVEVLTLQDNYVDLVARDNSEVVQRAMPIKGVEISNSILAEHGFSALITVTRDGAPRSILFDFGFSEHGAAFNADALSVDLSVAEAVVLSHGHLDHVGGIAKLTERIGKKGIPLVLHPVAFRNPRYVKLGEELKLYFPPFTREKAEGTGVKVLESKDPYPLLDDALLFLGEIPRKTPFERGMPMAHYEEAGEEKWDPIEDDTAIVANVKGKGLVVISGCAHAGIVNTVEYARKVTGVEKVFAVMGGFHLSGPDFADIVAPTTEALKAMDPAYVIPTHCTGRDACMYIEKEMPDQFLLNMAGTKLTFAA
jgi:7,8-dihydropterin-6-yl-methyl-4-(beta-D-ribofuranosyl)aminobenzene 5'-phosphate synthase